MQTTYSHAYLISLSDKSKTIGHKRKNRQKLKYFDYLLLLLLNINFRVKVKKGNKG